MSAWLWGSSTAPGVKFDELIDQATSSDLPTPSSTFQPPPELLSVSLQLSDLLRSAEVTPSNALVAIKRRFAIPNANVQLLTILLLDVLIKNSGEAFLKAASSDTSFNDEIARLARTSGNRVVQETMLRNLQNWASAFEAKPHLSGKCMVTTYKSLKNEGLPFPYRDASATAAMIDSLSAPEWVDSDLCSRCRDVFSITNRKHHCRNCGDIFDQKCSSKSMPLPHFGIHDLVRVCDGCVAKLATKGGRKLRTNSVDSRSTTTSRASDINSHRRSHSTAVSGPPHHQQEEDDLQLAMKLSLESAPTSNNFGSGYRPNATSSAQVPSQPPIESNATGTPETDDPDLSAAIAASLRDMEQPKPSAPGPQGTSELPANENPSVPPPPSSIQPAFELPSSDKDALLTFAQANESVKRHGKQVDTLTPLFERASAARPKLLRSLDESGRRSEVLTEMHGKLHEAVKTYDRVLERQISRHAPGFGRFQSSADQGPGGVRQAAPPSRQDSLSRNEPPAAKRQGSLHAGAQVGSPPQAVQSHAESQPPQTSSNFAYQGAGGPPANANINQNYAQPMQAAQSHYPQGQPFAQQQPVASAAPNYIQRQSPLQQGPAQFQDVRQQNIPANFPSVPTADPWQRQQSTSGNNQKTAPDAPLIDL